MPKINVKWVRESLTMDQLEFARFIGSDVRTVRRWEEGLAKPSGTACMIIASLENILKTANDKLFATIVVISGSIHVGGVGFLLNTLLNDFLAQNWPPKPCLPGCEATPPVGSEGPVRDPAGGPFPEPPATAQLENKKHLVTPL
jgi:transcriptional regulator with XRE-family HTH domain